MSPETPGRHATRDVPAVSLCIPLFMKERFVAETIRSILDQTFTDFELVILDNAGTDRSAEIAASFDDQRIRLVHNDTTIPAPENVAKAVSLARAPLVKVADADDLLFPTLVERQVSVLEQNPDVVVASCRHHTVDENGTVINRDRGLRYADLLGRQDRAAVLRRVVRHCGNPVGNNVNLMFRKSAYDRAGGMPDVPWIAQDVAMAIDLSRFGYFYGMAETLCSFRIATGSESNGAGREGIRNQVRFIDGLKQQNADLVRPSDLAGSALRMPLMRARHRLLVDAAGPRGSTRQRTATFLLGLSRAAS